MKSFDVWFSLQPPNIPVFGFLIQLHHSSWSDPGTRSWLRVALRRFPVRPRETLSLLYSGRRKAARYIKMLSLLSPAHSPYKYTAVLIYGSESSTGDNSLPVMGSFLTYPGSQCRLIIIQIIMVTSYVFFYSI